ncbi:uncharacterized protein LOC144124226 [Amblyomma americanum]
MTWAAFRRVMRKGCALLMVLRRQAAEDVMYVTQRRRRPFRMRVATAAYLLTYAGSVCQWPYEYQFYEQCGLARRDVYAILGMQQLAVLLGPYLAWLCFQRTTGPVMSPRGAIMLCLVASAAACEAKTCGLYREAAVIMGLGPSLAASLLDLRNHVLLVRHLKAYVSISALAATGVLVDVYDFGVQSVYSLASALYLAAAVVVYVRLNDTTGVVIFRPQAAAAQETQARLDSALCRLAELLEDTQSLSMSIARFLMDAVGVLNRAAFEVAGPYPCGRVVTSVAVVFLFRQTIDVIAMAFAAILRMGAVTNAALKGCGTLGCLATFAVAFHSVTPLRSEFCTAHIFLSFGTTIATAGDVTQPWHQSTLSGEYTVSAI